VVEDTLQRNKIHKVPNTPDAPITSAYSDVSATIKWTAPSSRGTPITSYTITIKKSDGNYISETVNCDGSNAVILAVGSCSIPFSTLRSAPFNLLWGSRIYVTVIAKNVFGSSGVSSISNGALMITSPSTPSVPSTLANSNASVMILWVAPLDGGSEITNY
jgi:hypothetical protein